MFSYRFVVSLFNIFVTEKPENAFQGKTRKPNVPFPRLSAEDGETAHFSHTTEDLLLPETAIAPQPLLKYQGNSIIYI